MGREREKKAQNFGLPPPFGAPTLLGPTFSGFGPPPFGAPTLRGRTDCETTKTLIWAKNGLAKNGLAKNGLAKKRSLPPLLLSVGRHACRWRCGRHARPDNAQCSRERDERCDLACVARQDSTQPGVFVKVLSRVAHFEEDSPPSHILFETREGVWRHRAERISNSVGSQGLNHQDCESWLIDDQVSLVCHA